LRPREARRDSSAIQVANPAESAPRLTIPRATSLPRSQYADVPDAGAEEGEGRDDEQDVVGGAVEEHEGHDAEQDGHEVPLPGVRAQPRHARTHLSLIMASGTASSRPSLGPIVLDVLVHFSSEAIGALGPRCALALCRHSRHRIAGWTSLGPLMLWLTVAVIGYRARSR